ncbi:MAG: hypothetical protein JOS17DRAFT_236896 [Linnemannia elongata]|nr:MAG: hypothetical protein JOS17DRAFT_236896 [Linnemannia elongata]
MKTTLGLSAHLFVFACPMQSPLSKTICWISLLSKGAVCGLFGWLRAPSPRWIEHPSFLTSFFFFLFPSLFVPSLPTTFSSPLLLLSFSSFIPPCFPVFLSLLLLLSFNLLLICLLL